MNNVAQPPEFFAKLSVENFPSRSELLSLLDSFLTENEVPKDYKIDNKDSAITLSFKSPEVAFEFVKKLNIEKLRNRLYAKIKTNMSIEVKPDMRYLPLKNTPHINHRYENALSTERLKMKRDTTSSSIDATLSKSSIRTKSLMMREGRGKSNTVKTSILRISTPYVSEGEKEKNEKKENKMKWLLKTDFMKFVGKATTNKNRYINYVSKTPSEPPLNYQFRRVNKEKWIVPTNFLV